MLCLLYSPAKTAILDMAQGGVCMPGNQSSVSHSVRGPGFKYDVLKGEFSKGSHVSKATHPVAEVEVIKQRLLQRKVLKDMGTHWELRSNVRTGLLMAVNLHAGELLTEPPL